MDRSTVHLLKAFEDELEHSEPLWRMYCLTRVLWHKYGVHYCEEERDIASAADWVDASRRLIHGGLGPQRQGSCASLPILLTAVGRRLGYPLRLVHSPGHLFCRWDSPEHPNPAWRERRNIEFNGDLGSHPDEDYYERPVRWTPLTFQMEAQREIPLYLRSLTPAEELASCLVQRAYVLEAHQRFSAARAAFGAAVSLAPHNDEHIYFAKQCHERQLEAILRPWGMTAERFCSLIQRRLRGEENNLFPWDMPGKNPSPENPYDNPESAEALRSAEQAVAARLSIQVSPEALPSSGAMAAPQRSDVPNKADAVDELFAADSDLF